MKRMPESDNISASEPSTEAMKREGDFWSPITLLTTGTLH